jgi:PAS domain S-box-containing protein
MKNQSGEKKSFFNSHLSIFVSLGLVLVFWALEYYIHFLLNPGFSAYYHFFGAEPMELHMRLLVTFMLLSFGTYAHVLITARKSAEKKAQQHTRQYQSLFGNMLNGLAQYRLLTDELNNPVDFVLLEANQAYYRITGLSPEQVLGRPASAATPWFFKGDLDWLDIYGRAALAGETSKTEIYSKHLGKWLLISVYSPEQGFFVTVIEDITQRKNIEGINRENQERMDTIFNSIQAGIMVVDRETHRVVYVNPAAARIMGGDTGQLIDCSCQKYICPADQGACPITDKGQKIDNSERTLLTIDGRQVPILKTVVETELDGRPVLVESFVDITERKALEEGNRLKALLLDSVSDGIVVHDFDGNISYFNQAACQIRGLSREEMAGMNLFFDMATPEALDKKEQRLRKIEQMGEYTFETAGRTKDGSIFQTEVRASLVDLYGQKNILSVSRDISERKRVEGELKTLNTALEQSPSAVIITDLDGQIEYVNNAFTKMTGYTKAETLSNNPRILKSGETSEQEYQALWKAITGGGEWRGEFHNRRKDGSLYWEQAMITGIKDQNGVIVKYVAVKQDITEQKKARQEVEDTRHRLELILSGVGEGIYGLDDKRRTIFMNPTAANLLGYSVEEMIGKVQHDVSHHTKSDGSHYDSKDCPINASIKDGQIHHVTGEVFWRKDGSSFPVEYTSTPTVENGRVNGSVVIFHDITERKQSEAMQASIYKISEISVASENLLELYAGIHMVIDELMNTANFYIALYNQKDELLEFPYFVDEKDARPASRPLKKGLTEYVLRTGSSLMAPPLMQKKMIEAGEIEMVGAPSIDWVGVPLKSGRDTFGAIVVQSYREQVRFGARELSMLNFVSDNIAAAIQRKKGEDERKKLVKDLQESLNNIKTLKGLVPICSSCKKIRNDGGYWQQVEEYVAEHTEADFSHGICDECAHKLYPQYFKDKKNKTKGDEVG